ncbi:hypothetical protein JYG23_04055 [Sedimentibacter sp. zth1]|uniref:S41 family peptidase n=1 Tax=Sedimentibacter sp. zth1 TaxID=2816908 RepID=UPI001A935BED|nr:S41 family peptidase [Sedimentibacter sp. zth1]QSX06638.1 hypothetical protein JYG23_04055 [Sedimentibacter sp. zth1]
MNYIEIFNEVVDIMHNDYAGCNDKVNIDNPEKYINLINKNSMMSEYDFLCLVKEYLLPFCDGHVAFFSNHDIDFSNGFSVRRYQDLLYVTNAKQESNIIVGDAIKEIDGKTIPQLEIEYSLYLQKETNERQKWREIIKKGSVCKIVHKDKSESEIVLKHYKPVNIAGKFSFKSIDKNTLIMTLPNFEDESKIVELINSNIQEIESKKNLIIDVRINDGGSDTSYFPLLKYIFSENVSIKKLFNGVKDYVNYSERNCANRLEMLTEYAKHEANEETKKLVDHMISQIHNNWGKGFVINNDDFDYEIKGMNVPEKVYILSDVYCGSSGDSFVETCKKSSKVTVIGRNTFGITDYSNCTFSKLGDFKLMYPLSRSNVVDEGKGIQGKGVDVDVYIPWTPAHLERDVDLEFVLNMCK